MVLIPSEFQLALGGTMINRVTRLKDNVYRNSDNEILDWRSRCIASKSSITNNLGEGFEQRATTSQGFWADCKEPV
jgi:hypothetical protein